MEELKLEEIDDRKWNIVACSAKTGEGIDLVLKMLFIFLGLQEGLEWIIGECNTDKE